MKRLEDFNIWRKGLEVAEEVQKVFDDLPPTDFDDLINSLRKTALSVPASLAEGFMMSNSRDTQVFFYEVLNSLDELRKGLVLTEQCGRSYGVCIHKIKSDISEVSRMIEKLIRPA